MKKTMIFSIFTFCIMTFFAFTPAENATAKSQADFFSTCTGAIKATAICATEDPSDATITITNAQTGVVAYSGPANGNAAVVTLVQGNYFITSDSRDCGLVSVQWEFCTPPNSGGNTVAYVNGTAFVGVLEIC